MLGNAHLATRFKRLTYQQIGEENIQFLEEMHGLREEMGTLPSAAMQFALVLPKLRFINTTFVVLKTTMKLACDESVRAKAADDFAFAVKAAKAGAKDAAALLACFEPVEAAVTAACEALAAQGGGHDRGAAEAGRQGAARSSCWAEASPAPSPLDGLTASTTTSSIRSW